MEKRLVEREKRERRRGICFLEWECRAYKNLLSPVYPKVEYRTYLIERDKCKGLRNPNILRKSEGAQEMCFQKEGNEKPRALKGAWRAKSWKNH